MEYPKIETLYERDMSTFKVNPAVLKNRTYGLLKTWSWTEKVDGTNIRCIYRDGALTFGGRSDKAQLDPQLWKWLTENITIDKMKVAFPTILAPDPSSLAATLIHPCVILYGEGYGAGIQKDGGRYRPDKAFILFDVLICDPSANMGGWWLNDDQVCDVAVKLSIPVVPSFGIMTLEDATELVRAGINSVCAQTPLTKAEGLVGRPLETLFDKKGHRLIVKLKTKDFA